MLRQYVRDLLTLHSLIKQKDMERFIHLRNCSWLTKNQLLVKQLMIALDVKKFQFMEGQ